MKSTFAKRLRNWGLRWLLFAVAIAVVVTGLGPLLVTRLLSGEALLDRAATAVGRPVTARAVTLTGTAFQPPRLILSEPVVGDPDRPLLAAATVEVDLGWPVLVGVGRPAAVSIVDGLVDLTALPAGDAGDGRPGDGEGRDGTAATGDLPTIAFSGALRLPGGLDLTNVDLTGDGTGDGALSLVGGAMLDDRAVDLAIALRDPVPTAAGLGGRIEASLAGGEDRLALNGGFETAPRPSFRGRLDLSVGDPSAWAQRLSAPLPAGLNRLGGLTAEGLVYIAGDRLSVQDIAWSTPAREGRATLALETVSGLQQIAGEVSVNRFELADLGALIDWQALRPGSGIGTIPLDLTLTVDRFGLGPLDVADARLALGVDPPGTISVGTEELRLFDGTARLQLAVRLGAAEPRLAGSLQLAGLPIVPVATALALEGLPLSGLIDASITVNGQGSTLTAVARGLQGDGFLRLRDGTVSGIDGIAGGLEVTQAGGGLSIDRGRVSFQTFRIDGPTAALAGPVTVALPAGTLAGRLRGGVAGEDRVLAVGGSFGSPDLDMLPAE